MFVELLDLLRDFDKRLKDSTNASTLPHRITDLKKIIRVGKVYWGKSAKSVFNAYLSVGEACKLCLLNKTMSPPTLVAEFAITLNELLNGLPSMSQTLIVTNGC